MPENIEKMGDSLFPEVKCTKLKKNRRDGGALHRKEHRHPSAPISEMTSVKGTK